VRGTERQQLAFLRWGRPGAAVSALLVFVLYDLIDPGRQLHVLIGLIVLALGISALDQLALRRWPVGRVARVTMTFDVLLIAVVIAVLNEDGLLVVPFFAPVAFGALLFGPVETALYALLGVVSAILIGPIIDATTITTLASCLILAITGAILAGLSFAGHTARQELSVERAADAAALRITERIRSSVDVEEILRLAAEELGPACGADRCLLRLAVCADGSAPSFEWRRDRLAPWHPSSPSGVIHRIFESGERIVVDDLEKYGIAFSPEVRAGALVGYPISRKDAVVAVLAVTDERPRDWSEGVLQLLDRLAPQIGAALAQAELFAEQQKTLKLREELIANVSHELRTPLTSTIGFLRTLERPDISFTDEERSRFLGTARREAERLAELVGDLLDLTRLQRGVLALNRQLVRLNVVVNQAALGLELPEGRQLRVELDDDIRAEADPNRLVQVITNLISNAIKHGEGAVLVSGGRHNGDVTFLVTDEGPGVPADRVGELFVPFAHWGEAKDSTGLGLAIARGIIEAHGGSLEYRQAENGTPHAFVVALPVAAQT
jgi:signal transduction histidine kinase